MFELPIIPLHTVLFPGMPLQLHIFEERYKQMIAHCRETGSPFGVTLIRHGMEANGPLAEPHRTGCWADITRVESLEGGRFNLFSVGRERFQIHTLNHDKPYLTAMVSSFPLKKGRSSEEMVALNRLRTWLARYVRTLSPGDKMDETLQQIPDDPPVFAYLAAVILQTPLQQKQALLEFEFVADMLNALVHAYRRETAILEKVLTKTPPATPTSFSMS